ncbi:MAG TPA: hypothetical protein VN365_00120, partial [Candidatus Thermoplasmatota archaeon]|nr:hypothetical protein [Candidatus Thermoplasmatota archaeon]
EMGGNMKNKKIRNIFVSMLVGATIMMVAGTSIAKNTTQQSSSSEIEWIHTFDSILNDRAYYVDQTADGGYIFTGSTIVTPPGYTELLLVKTDGNGEESWHNNFPIALTNLYGTVVHQTTDGGYIIVGSVGGSWLWDVQVTKTDANGDLVWQKSFGKSDGPDHGSDILQTSDGGYIVLGDTSTYGQGGYDLWLIKLAADGTEQWNKTIGGATFDEPKSFTKAVDGGYVIVGNTDAVDSMGDVWVVKTNDAGELSWQKTFGNSNLTENGVCIKTESDGYIILGNLYDMNWTENPWLLRLDAQGTLTWDQQISVNGTVHGTSITTTTDGGYFITGSLYDMINYVSDAYLLKLNHQGATQWVKSLDVSNGLCDEANCGIQARDGGYVAVGSTGDLNNWTGDTFILKIEAENGVVLDSVTGRFGVQAHVKNLGTTEATDVSVSIKITGGILHLINVSYMETISIPAGEEATVSCKPFLGLGSIDIAVTVNGVTTDYEGKQLIILTQVES